MTTSFLDRLRQLNAAQALLARRRHLVSDPGAEVPEATSDAVRLLTLNLAHGRGPRQTFVRRQRLESNLAQVAATIRGLSPDIVALQEADGPSSWSGNFDHVATLAELSELEEHFRGDHNPYGNGSRFTLNTGTALLSRLELLEPHSHRFAENWRDTKGFVIATVEIPQWGNRSLDVVSVHLDFLVPSIRRRQIEQMSRVLAERNNPLVLLGDLNCCFVREPRSMELLAERLGVTAFEPDLHSPTYPSLRPIRRLDWILVSPELEFGGYGTLPTRLSDHLLVTADLVLSSEDN